MASLLSLLGLGNSSGMPIALSDEEQQQLAAQQTQPTSGLSALFGVSGPNSTSATDQPMQAAVRNSLLSSATQGGNSTDDDTQTATPDTPASQAAQPAQSDNSSDANTATSGSDSSATAPGADASTPAVSPNASVASSAAGSDSKPGFLSSLLREAKTDPKFGQALMAAGFSMMANSRYGTPGLAAVGMGGLQGLQTFDALKQRDIANQMAVINAQRQWQTAQVDNAAKQATTQSTQLGNASKIALINYTKQAGQNFTINGAIAAGALPADAISAFQGMHPNLTISTDDAGNVTGVNPQTGQRFNLGNAVKITNTAAGTQTTAYNGGGAGTGAPIVPQVVQEGGLSPEQVDKNVAQFQNAQAAAVKLSHSQDQMLNQLQSAAVLSGSGGGLLGAGWRGLQGKLGMDDPNSTIRQQFAATNVQGIVNAIPSSSRMDQTFLQQMEHTVANPSTATPEQMIRATAFIKSKADYDAVDNEARAAFVTANNGMQTPLKKDAIITVGGQRMNVPAGTTVQQVADAATDKLVSWDPPLINPNWADGRSQPEIDKALAYAKQSPAQLKKLRDAGVLLPSNMRKGG